MLYLNHHVASKGVLMRKSGENIVDRGVGQAFTLKDVQPFLRGLGSCDILDLLLKLDSVRYPLRVDLVSWVILPLRTTQAVA